MLDKQASAGTCIVSVDPSTFVERQIRSEVGIAVHVTEAVKRLGLDLVVVDKQGNCLSCRYSCKSLMQPLTEEPLAGGSECVAGKAIGF